VDKEEKNKNPISDPYELFLAPVHLQLFGAVRIEDYL
jgi:hypothetical protein